MLNRRISSTAAARSLSRMTQAPPLMIDLRKAINKLTPLHLADTSWDNVGELITVPEPRDVQNRTRRILLTIDLTTSVVDEAISHPSTSLILTYHPPIFRPLKSLTTSDPIQSSLLRCIQKGINVFTIHTAADSARDGTNEYIASAFLSESEWPITKETRHSRLSAIDTNGSLITERTGIGRKLELEKGIGLEEAANMLKKRLGIETLQIARSGNAPSQIATIAICAGSGSSVLRGVEADLFVTGEMDHHSILAANAAGTHVILTHHTKCERPWLDTFAPRLEKEMNELRGGDDAYEVVVSEKDKDPLEYF